jgi:hypothetical protein
MRGRGCIPDVCDIILLVTKAPHDAHDLVVDNEPLKATPLLVRAIS